MSWRGRVKGGRKAKEGKASGASAPVVEGFHSVEGDRRRSRRRVWMVAAVAALLACVAVPVVVAGRWFVQGTIEAGRGAATPAVAVLDYFQDTPLGGPLAGDEVEVNLFCDGEESRLHRQVLDLIKAARRAEVPGKITFDRVEEHPSAGREGIHGDRAGYRTEAQWSYANVDPNRKPGTWSWWDSNFQPWSFELVNDDGWRVCGVNAPNPCAKDSGINCDPVASVPSPAPTTGKVWDTTVPYRCLPDRPYRDLEKVCASPPASWVQPGPYYCAPDQPLGIPATRRQECTDLGWS
ncbi:hypothetical protein Rhe02_83950 [Rhizocola hellebori]|uniref:Uncharacterized protein n=1 Tax=Rhizocola hellebori TaxID=1392758 RepID=A0A8J3QJ15_9ACTN|nr:hypothetical protein [Rhizocola hellebori]GIH10328.1 hypothetical protein Rhe02_83950 [Rhizocola hellebori]